MRFTKLGSISALALTLTACGGPTVADLLQDELVLTLSGFSSAPESVAVSEPQGGLGVERAVLRVTSISLNACQDDVADVMLGARAFDLLSVPAPSELVSTSVTDFCSIELDIDPTSQNAVAEVPDDATLFATGVDAAGEAFELASERSHSLRFEASTPFGAQPLLLGLDVATLLGNLPPPLTGEDAREQMAAQLATALALYADANGNHELDADETTPLASASPR
jgi:hypothetical protein